MTLAAAQPAENEELLRFLGADARLCSPSQQRWQVRARDVLANKVVGPYCGLESSRQGHTTNHLLTGIAVVVQTGPLVLYFLLVRP
jgi:hypothetical protein